METKPFLDTYPVEPTHSFEGEIYVVPPDLKTAARDVFKDLGWEAYCPEDHEYQVDDPEAEVISRIEHALTDERRRCMDLILKASKDGLIDPVVVTVLDEQIGTGQKP